MGSMEHHKIQHQGSVMGNGTLKSWACAYIAFHTGFSDRCTFDISSENGCFSNLAAEPCCSICPPRVFFGTPLLTPSCTVLGPRDLRHDQAPRALRAPRLPGLPGHTTSVTTARWILELYVWARSLWPSSSTAR